MVGFAILSSCRSLIGISDLAGVWASLPWRLMPDEPILTSDGEKLSSVRKLYSLERRCPYNRIA
jgi:hypothetical protein